MRKTFVLIAAVMLWAGFLTPAVLSAGPPDVAAVEAPSAQFGPFDLNSVSYEELVSIPGIGPKLAERILDYRAENDGYSHVDELLDIKGVGTRNLEKFRTRFTLTTPPHRVATTPLPTP